LSALDITAFTNLTPFSPSSTVGKSTIDEAPFAYKPMDEIIEQIAPTAEIIAKIKPVYNFKAAEQSPRRRK